MSDPTTVAVKYTGDQPFVDRLYGSGLEFMPNQTRLVDPNLAERLVKHAEFEENDGYGFVTYKADHVTGGITKIWSGTQAQYDAIATPADDTLYIIVEA